MAISSDKADKPIAVLSDQDLVDRALQRDRVAFELIVRRHNQALFRAARGVLNDEQQAQDVVQEAYIKAFTRLESFKERATLKTWLTRIVVNQAIDFKRRRQPDQSMDENVLLFHNRLSEGGDMAGQIVDHSTPESETANQELKILLETATRRLPEIYRCVFILREVEGLSVADCAFCLGINQTLVKKRLSRARRMLREDLLETIEPTVSDIFEFAGSRCDSVTSYVMAELAIRGMVEYV